MFSRGEAFASVSDFERTDVDHVQLDNLPRARPAFCLQAKSPF